MSRVVIYLLLLLHFNEILSDDHDVGTHPAIYRFGRKKIEDNVLKIFGEPTPSGKHNQICFLENSKVDAPRICLEKTDVSNITTALYRIYKNHVRRVQLTSIDELLTISKEIHKFVFMDHALLARCLLQLPDVLTSVNFQKFAIIVDKMLTFANHTFHTAIVARKYMTLLRNVPTDVTFNTTNIVINKWRPLKDKVVGIALHKIGRYSYNVTRIGFEHTCESVNRANLEMAAYVPVEFLNDPAFTQEQKNNLTIIMIMVLNGTKYKNFFEIPHNIKRFIALSIEGVCKKNTLPVLKTYFTSNAPINEWKEFGRDYFDSFNYNWYTCILSKLSFYGPLEGNEYLESVRENFCITNGTDLIPGSKLKVTPIHSNVYPEKICINKDFQIPSVLCGEGGTFFNYEELDLTCYPHPTSNKTSILYELLLGCYYKEQCSANPALIDELDTTYVDIGLHFFVLRYIRDNFDRLRINVVALAKILNTGLILIEAQAKHNQLIYVNGFIRQFLHCLPTNYVGETIIQDKFIFKSFKPFKDGILGLIIDRQSEELATNRVELLTKRTVPRNHHYNGTAETIVYITKTSLKSIKKNFDEDYDDLKIDIMVILENNFKDSNQYPCKSNIVAIQHTRGYSVPVVFDVYLRTISSDGDGKKHWFTVRSNEANPKMIFISEPVNSHERILQGF